jgi:hypothetical protein
MVKFGDEFIEKQGDSQTSQTHNIIYPCVHPTHNCAPEVPEWSSKYLRYKDLVAMLEMLPKRDKASRKSDNEVVYQLEHPTSMQQRGSSPPPPMPGPASGSDASLSSARPHNESKRRLSVTAAFPPNLAPHDVLGRVSIELRSVVSGQKEFSHEEYQYFTFMPDIQSRDAFLAKEIAALSAACKVHSYVPCRPPALE